MCLWAFISTRYNSEHSNLAVELTYAVLQLYAAKVGERQLKV